MTILSLLNPEWGRSYKVGTFYDYAYDTGQATGEQWLVPRYGQFSMPINSLHPKASDGTYRQGGPWIMCKFVSNQETISSSRYRYLRNTPNYLGEAFINPTLGLPYPTGWDPTWNSTSSLQARYSSVGARGAEAWNRMRPDKPDFSAATSLLELKDLVGPLKQGLKNLISKVDFEKSLRRANRKSEHQRTGNRHLEVQFGWLPLLGDIRNFVEAFEKRHKRFDKMLRDEGKPLHRRTEFAGKYDKHTTSYTTATRNSTFVGNLVGQVYPTAVTQCYVSEVGDLTSTTRMTHKEKWWAEGQFRYLLPPGPKTDAWKAKMVRRIMGGYISPSTVYNLIPWTWLVDYFTDVGQMMEAISPGIADRLICDYAYVMATFEGETKYSDMSPWLAGKTGGVNMVEPSITKTFTIKMRYPASPFGFGLKMSDLNPTQVGILGALGLSKI